MTANCDNEGPPNLAEIERLARPALRTTPKKFRDKVESLIIRVNDFPDAATEREMGLKSSFDLLGLYRGVSLDRKGISDAPEDVDIISLYRRPILD